MQGRLAGGLDPIEWRERHELGQVPDRVPYGLDRMSGYGVQVEVARPPLPVRRFGAKAQSVMRSPYDWSSALQRNGAQAILCWDERTGVPAALVSRRPVFTGVIWATEDVRSGVVVRALRRAAGVFTLSTAQLSVLRGWGVQDPTYIAMGVDASFFCPGSTHDRGSPTVLSVGNDRHRDFDTVIAAHRALGSREVGLRIVTRRPIVATHPTVTVLAALSHSELVAEYACAAVVAVGLRPNLHVSGITTTLEAMACARPVVVTDTPGMRDYIDDGSTGLLVPAGNAGAMADAVDSLLEFPGEAAEMGRRARAAVESNFSTEHQAQRLADWIRARL